MPSIVPRAAGKIDKMDAFEACRVIGRQLGLPTDDLTVLAHRGNLIVRFGHSDVVARVSSLTAFTRRDPGAWLAREVEVSRFAVSRGGQVVPPAPEPGPYCVDGVHLSLWRFVEVEPRLPTAQEVGKSLAELHVCLRDFPGELATMTPARDQISDGLAALHGHGDPAELTRLATLQQRYLAEVDGAASDFVLHGDAHPGNLLSVGGAWLWADFEETCRGPLLWDLAILQRNTKVDGAAAIRAYCEAADRQVPTLTELRPFMRLRDIEAAVWAAGVSVQAPERYGALARDLMMKALGDGQSAKCE